MKRMTNGVSFKSLPGMYEIEENGVKPNTIRMMTEDDCDWLESEHPSEIWIVNTKTEEVFVRNITNVLVVGKLLNMKQVLISWWHPR